MVTLLSVMSSDSRNRYGFYILIQALESGVLQTYASGIPYLINHDAHRPLGWNTPFALFIESKLTRQLSRVSIPETDEEQTHIIALHEGFRNWRYREDTAFFSDDFRKLLEKYGLTDLHLFSTNCVTCFQTGIAKNIFPDLFAQKDKEGLISLSTILTQFDYIGDGTFKDKNSNIVLFAHHYFRRSQSIHNSVNSQFLDEFMEVAEDKALDAYLCLDEDLVGYAPSVHNYMELEFVYGPPFNDDITSIKPGLVKHQNTDSDRRLSGITSTEILWEWDKTLYTFQLEEISDREAPMEDESVFHCRYVHSIYNEAIQDFDHFDGAIRTYPFEDMVDRASMNFKEYGKRSSYKKLFKINKKLAISKWKSLVTLYLRGNPLIYEYFGLQNEVEKLKRLPKPEPELIDQLIPFAITPEDGVKILVSYFPVKENIENGRYIDSFDLMSDDDKQYRCIDFPVLEFKKALERIGEELPIPDDVLFIKCDDRYINIPSIVHIGEDAYHLLQKSVEALLHLFKSITAKGLDFDISVTLGLVVEGKLIKVSAYGNIIPLSGWLADNMPFPGNQREFSEWLVRQRIYLNAYEQSGKDTFVNSLVQFDGVLYIKRVSVAKPYEFEVREEGLGFKGTLTRAQNELLNSDKVKIVATLAVEKCICIDTGEDYFLSKRSKWLDNDLKAVAISQCSPLALYWSKN